MSEFEPTIKDLNCALADIQYERITMLNARYRLCSDDFRDSDEMNMLIEVCSLHTRALFFFLLRESRPDRQFTRKGDYRREAFDVWAGDYFTEANPYLISQSDFPHLVEFEDKVGRFLAHLSYKRQRDSKPNLGFISQAVDQIEDRLYSFRARADMNVDWTRFDLV